MRKPVQFALIAVIVLLLGVTAALFMKYRKSSADYVDMKAAEEAARTHYAQTIDAIAEIQDSLNAISLGDTTVRILSQDLQTEQGLTGPTGRDALDRIAVLRASIQRSKEMIRRLETDLKKSGVRTAGLEKMVAHLKQSVTEKEVLIAELTGRVDSLETQVTGLATEVQQNQDTLRVRDQTIEDRRRELATVYYIVGTKKELTASGIVVAKGGVLGIGKALQPSGHFDENLFTPLDTDKETVVPTSAAKVQVLSAQPPSSYELRLIDGRMQLHILDPVAFRKIRQLVIMTA